jgi:hypothetical protein
MNSTPATVAPVADAPGASSRYFANSATTPDPLSLRTARTKRFALLDGLQDLTTVERLTHCRRHRAFMADWVGIVQRDGVSTYTGLQTCGSIWVCPVCSAKVRHERTLQLASVSLNWMDAGGGLTFPTLTLAHRNRDPLRDTLGHLLEGWRYVTGRRDYARLRDRYGIEHTCRAVEITHGWNGWHPHIHGLLFSRRPLTSEETRDVMAALWRLWNHYAESNSLRVLVPKHAVVVKSVSMNSERGIAALAEYLFKVQDGYGIAAELMRADLKRGRSRSSRTPFDIAESAVRGHRGDRRLWREYESVVPGRRSLDWSKGSAKALGMGQSDDELASANPADGHPIYDLTPYEWDLVLKYRMRGRLLNVADKHGAAAVGRTVERLRLRDLERDTHDHDLA